MFCRRPVDILDHPHAGARRQNNASPEAHMQLLSLPASQLVIGIPAAYTLRDDKGQVLLQRGRMIENTLQLEALRARGTIYIDYEESVEAQRQLVNELDNVTRRDAPLSVFAAFVPSAGGGLESAAKTAQLANLAVRWGEMEARLIGLLGSITAPNNFAARAAQLDTDIRALLAEDRDAALYLMFHQSISAYASYSAAHSLLCAVLCDMLCDMLGLPEAERSSLNRAALTMNVAMTALQDQLALQRHPPSPQQQDSILTHAVRGRILLARAGVTDDLWLDVVACHHEKLQSEVRLLESAPVQRLARVLQTIDRYTAAMSPRKSRTGRTARDSARAVIVQSDAGHDEVGTALVRLLGLSPPGTYVKLATGEVGVVLRRGAKPNQPIVAVVLNKREEPIAEAKLVNTSRDGMAVQSAVAAANVRVRLNQDVMLKLLDRARTENNDGLPSPAPVSARPAGDAPQYTASTYQRLL